MGKEDMLRKAQEEEAEMEKEEKEKEVSTEQQLHEVREKVAVGDCGGREA